MRGEGLFFEEEDEFGEKAVALIHARTRDVTWSAKASRPPPEEWGGERRRLLWREKAAARVCHARWDKEPEGGPLEAYHVLPPL